MRFRFCGKSENIVIFEFKIVVVLSECLISYLIRVLIAQAEEAAKALEAVVTKDKSALAPLLETRRLLAEAVHSIESTTRQRHRQPLDNLVMGKDQDIH
jgi:hypothetical protein